MIHPQYRELWQDPAIQTRIDESIRQNRQSEGTVRTTDYSGNPIPGVKVRVRQCDTPFHFGANIFKLGDYPPELARKYEEAYCALFNGATVPFYWRTLEPEQGRPRYRAHSMPPIARRPPPDTVVDFCQRHGLRMHGHTLVWEYRKWSVPDWLPEDPALSVPLWEKRFREIGERYGHSIPSWDVLNEAADCIVKTPTSHTMCENFERMAFAFAEKYFPEGVRFDINETTAAWNIHRLDFTHLVERLLREKARIGGIGLQFHLFTDAELEAVGRGEKFGPAELFAALDHYAKFQRPLHVSEITLTAPGNTPESLEAQAEIARNFYRLWFSHPAVSGISWWNVPDGGAAPGESKVFSGLLFADMTPKPAYAALQNLLLKEWRTETSGVTDADGNFHFRGFHGTYLIDTESDRPHTGDQSAITLEPGKKACTRIGLI